MPDNLEKTKLNKIVSNFQKVDDEINKIQESIKMKYICNKKHMNFLSELLEDSIYRHNKITKT